MKVIAMRKVLAFAVLLVALVSSGCGYTLAGRGSFLPESIKTIGVPDFTNRTPYFEVGQLLTQSVRTELIGRGKYKILPQETDVDAVLRAEITSFNVAPTNFNSDQQATGYAITVTVGIQLVNLHDNKILWQNPSQPFRQEYQLSSDSASGTGGTIDTQQFLGGSSNAVDRVAQDFARSVVSAILEAF